MLTAQVGVLYDKWNRPLDDSQLEEEVAGLILAIVEAEKNYDPARRCFRAWANKVAMRRLADRQRAFFRERARPKVRNQASFGNDGAFDLLLECLAARPGPLPSDERTDVLLRELGRLPEKERYAIHHKFLEEDDYASIAHHLGVTEAAARGVVCRGLKRLGERMQAALRRRTPFSA
jgi:RNA polymerase sigma factor (sigma-70 family)